MLFLTLLRSNKYNTKNKIYVITQHCLYTRCPVKKFTLWGPIYVFKKYSSGLIWKLLIVFSHKLFNVLRFLEDIIFGAVFWSTRQNTIKMLFLCFQQSFYAKNAEHKYIIYSTQM